MPDAFANLFIFGISSQLLLYLLEAAVFKIRTLVLLVSLLLGSAHAYAGDNNYKVPVVERMLELYHGFPRPLDDSLCKDVLNDYLLELDEEHMYFSQQDIEAIRKSTDVKAGIGGKAPGFLDTIIARYRKQLLWADTIVNSILQQPFDFSLNDSVLLSDSATPYAIDNAELKQRWYHLLKYETLHRITDIAVYDTLATRDSMLRAQGNEEQVVLKMERRRIQRVLNCPQGYEDFMRDLFCNTLATAYDPHTEFLPVTAQENFVGELSGGGYQFGFELGDNDKQDVEIIHLTPGSPAWKCGQLNQNDVLLQMQWAGEPVIDLAGADAEEVSEMLAVENHKELNLTVRKANGMKITLPLHKEQIKNDEDFVKSYILNGPVKLGYILLPGFYTEWENNGSSNCAKDVAREALKLKDEHVEGIILDLRNNGGGSIDEAMALAGIFIDDGALGFNRERNEKPHVMKDPNKGVLYDGPLLVMVNGQTASASEFVVAALQDYNRAIIVGSRTFGKATYQTVLPCDTSINFAKVSEEALNNYKSDYIKITLGKLYRVTGKSNQGTGARPDIELPDAFAEVDEHEAALKHSLPNDSIKHAANFKPLAPLPLQTLAALSQARVNASSSFGLIKQGETLYKQMDDIKKNKLPLQFDPFLKLALKYGSGEMKLYKQLELDSIRPYIIENYGSEKARLEASTYEADDNKRILSDLMHDFYIQESFLILSDYIRLDR